MNWLQKTNGRVYNGILYHGTNKVFDSFDISFAGVRDWGDFGVGFYFSTSPWLAIRYSYAAVDRGGGNPVIHVTKANLQNVATFDELIEVINFIALSHKSTSKNVSGRLEADSRAITARMLEFGFDGAQVGEQMVVYDASNVTIIKTITPKETIH